MEKIFTNKSIWKKIVVAILIIMAFQVFVSIPVVRADNEGYGIEEGDNLGWGGVLLKPIMSLLVTLGDGVMNIMHSSIMGVNASLLHIDLKEGDIIWQALKLIISAVIIAVAVIAAIATLGGSAVVTGAILAVVGGAAIGVPVVTMVGDAVGGVTDSIMHTVASTVTGDYTPEDIYLPIYTFTPEEIFKGNILLFNVDFFNTSEEIKICYRTKTAKNENNEKKETTNVSSQSNTNGEVSSTNPTAGGNNGSYDNIGQHNAKEAAEAIKVETATTNSSSDDDYILGTEDNYGTYKDYINNNLNVDRSNVEIKYYYYVKDGKADTEENRIKTSPQDSAVMLKSTISRWYVAIRNICIVGMLSVLIYIGIRMMLTSVANDKAKYKEMLKDWIVGMCLLFVMHYIMAFSVVLVEKITDIISNSVSKDMYTILLNSPNDGNSENDMPSDKLEKLREGLKEAGLEGTFEDGEGNVFWPTNLMGYLRLRMQFDKSEGQYIGEVICFLILVIFTGWFTFTYFKRLLYMAFLTIISPLVALTYPIDKVSDGQAQGFNTWLKEYIFNLLIQPMHLLLYFILITSAFNLAGTNVIYSLVAIGFMIPAEKLLRSMFGFEKAKTPPFLGGPVGTSLVMQGLNRLSGAAGKGAKGGNGAKAIAESNTQNSDAVNGNRHNARSVYEMFANNGQQGDEEGTEAPSRNSEMSSGDRDGDEFTEDAGETTETAFGDEVPSLLDQNGRPVNQEDVPLWTQWNRGRASGEIQGESFEDYRTRMNEQAESEYEAINGEQIDDVNGSSRMEPRRRENNSNSTTSENTSNARGLGNRVWNSRAIKATRAAGRVALKNAPAKIKQSTWKGVKGAVKGAARAAAGLPAGVLATGIGAAAGIASGDPSKAATAIGTGIGVGVAIGNRVTASAHLSEETKAAFDAVYNNEENKEKDRERDIKKSRNNELNKIKAEQVLGSKEAAEEFLSEDGNYAYWSRQGEKDIDDMLAAERLINEHKGTSNKVSRDRALATVQLSRRFGGKDPEDMTDKEKSNLDKTLVGGFGEHMDKTQAKNEAKNAKELLHEFHGYRYS